jgi:hypothetical protein
MNGGVRNSKAGDILDSVLAQVPSSSAVGMIEASGGVITCADVALPLGHGGAESGRAINGTCSGRMVPQAGAERNERSIAMLQVRAIMRCHVHVTCEI